MSEQQVARHDQRTSLWTNYTNNFLHDLFDSSGRQRGFPTSERRGILHYFVVVDVMPDGQQYSIFTAHLTLNESIQLILRPLLFEERLAEDDHAKPRLAQPSVNRLADTVSELEGKFVVPNLGILGAQCIRQRTNEHVFVLRSVANEDIVEHDRFIRWRSAVLERWNYVLATYTT